MASLLNESALLTGARRGHYDASTALAGCASLASEVDDAASEVCNNGRRLGMFGIEIGVEETLVASEAGDLPQVVTATAERPVDI